MSEHARLMPSSAMRWVECPGSVVMQERYPQTEESEDAREGTASHWVGAAILEHAKGGAKSDYRNFVNQTAPNGVILTEEMTEGADVYARDVLQIRATVANDSDYELLHVEEKVAIGRIHPTESWGTPDAWLYDRDAGVLYVWDYKYGHRIVHPYDNWQLIDYTIGILDGLFPDDPEPEIVVEIRIVQPRSFHREGPVRSWRVKPVMLRAYINRLQDAAINALGDDPRTASGPWCRDCTGRHVCRTLQESAMCAVDMTGDLSADELPPTALGIEIHTLERAIKAMEYRVEALKTQAIETIRGGTLIPGWSTERGQGRQKWDKPNAEVFALGDCMGVELRKDPEPRTPKQAIAAGIAAAVIKAYSTIPSTGLKLVPDDGKVKRIFTQPEG